jgi:hypothetical protein
LAILRIVSGVPAGVRVEKAGDTVELIGRFTISEGADDWVVLFVLPDGYRPEGTIACGVGSQGGPLELWIEPDGSVSADSPQPGWIELAEISYPAA